MPAWQVVMHGDRRRLVQRRMGEGRLRGRLDRLPLAYESRNGIGYHKLLDQPPECLRLCQCRVGLYLRASLLLRLALLGLLLVESYRR